ncbi:hypothetical protein COL52_30960 [Bacillus toyonensis]|nr:hypothetical protein CN688_28490 [Bacillus toyonensis]PEK81793.1 hypothetical protein CN594_22430 [Bacillus toyonensis]PEL16914.1 hypothetical protein CN624_30155 [Bacillus toyonensis]PFY36791.1 hypothetical protein COL55_28650 [Bacillus toyonensis]PFY53747.1 hypothetical protein COL52_30960 [Bacillus toyonensis]
MGGLLMNQNYNNNEYEIMDNGVQCCTPRYPLAQAPGSELQSMNYQDVTETSIGREYQAVQQVNVGEAVSAALGILTTILKAANPILGTAAGVISSIFGFLWKRFGTDPQSQWKQFMEAVEYLVSQKITDAVRSKAVSELEGVQRAVELYQEAANAWNMNPDDAAAKERIRRQYTSTNTVIEFAMPSFRVGGFEVPLLTVYAQAANLHLLLLRDAVKFGAGWGFSPTEVEDNYTRLQARTAEYTNHCTNTYDKGLKQAYDLAPNPTDYNKYPYLNPYSKDPIYGKYYTAPVDWNLFNDFRRDMTLMVLDIVAVWPTYNPRLYNNPNGVQIQLSREVYSTVYGRAWSNNSTVDAIESTLVRPPHLVTELTKLTFDERNLYEAETVPVAFRRVANTLHNVGSSTTWEQSFSATSVGSLKAVHNVAATDIGNLALSLGAVPLGFSFYNKNDQHLTTVGYSGGWWNGIPKDEGSNQNSHHLSYVAALETQSTAGWWPYTYPVPLLGEWGFGWLHNSLTPTNEILSDKITQIPAVKAFNIQGNGKVTKGPGSTGGDLIALPAPSGQINIYLKETSTKNYRVRLRYAATTDGQLRVALVRNGGAVRWFENIKYVTTGASENSLAYNQFKYVDIFTSDFSNINSLVFINQSGGTILIDQIEFIPIEGSLEVFEAEQDLENARKAVNALFTGAAKDVLKLNVTDYAVDQAANLVECVSDEMHPKEKMILLDQVKFAKRLSQTRNLLNYGDFESDDWSGANGWKTSNHVHVAADNPIFKGRYLHMPGATSSQLSSNVYPTYAYQKVDESKLKSYTRYLVRGFIGNSKDLELLVERYGKDVYVEMDVPNDIQYALPMNECGGFDRCGHVSYQAASHHTCTCKNTAQMDTDCQCKDKVNRTAPGVYTNTVPGSAMYTNGYHSHKSCGCKDSHVFSYHIDTGCVDQEENLGLWFALKIASENGVAKIDNLEIIEAQPLTGEALARVKKREHKWKQEMAQKRLHTEKAVQAARDAIQRLFTSPKLNRLKFETLLQQILNADALVQKISYVYHSFLIGAMPTVPGMNNEIYQKLSAAIAQARALYEQRNLVRNGTFSSGTGSWHVSDGVEVQPLQNTFVLVLSEWSDEASQDRRIDPERGYVLRVTARKEGAGKGTVTISDCADYTEKLTFTSCDYNTVGSQTMTSGTLSGFVTKTLEIFPDTDRIRIDIGETEGTFKIESVELICMEQMEDHMYDMAGNVEASIPPLVPPMN